MKNTRSTKQTSLFVNYIYNLSGQLLNILFPIITAPYLARILREEGNGQIAFVNSIVAYFVSFASFGFTLYGQREIAKCRDDVEERSRIFFDLLVLRVLFCAVSLVALFMFIASPLIIPRYKFLVSVSAIQVVAVIFDIQFFYQGIEDFKSLTFRTVLVRVAGLICLFLFVRNQDDVWKYLLYTSTTILLANAIMWPKAFSFVKYSKSEFSLIKHHIKPAFFIYLPVLSGTIISVLDSTMIGYLAINPEYENGCYGTAMKLINIVSVVMMADGLVLASRNARDYASGKENLIREHLKIAFRYVWMLGFPIIAGLLILSNQISLCVFGQGYEKVPTLLRLFTIRVLTHGIINVIANQYLLTTGREKICTAMNFCGISINIILNFLFIPSYGCIGAAIASIIAEVLVTCSYVVFLICEKKFWNKAIIFQGYKYIVASAVMSIPIILLKQIWGYQWYLVGIIIVIGALTYGLSLLVMKDEMVVVYGSKIIAKIKGK